MKITCDVISDLLPLYAEDMATDDSRRLVENHVAECERCKAALNKTIAKPIVPIETDNSAIIHLGQDIRKRKWVAVILALSLLITIALGVVLKLTSREYLGVNASITSLTELDSGRLLVAFSDEVDGYSVNYADFNNGHNRSAVIRAWKSPYGDIMNQAGSPKEILLEETVTQVSFYRTMEDGSVETSLWGDFYGGTVQFSKIQLSEYMIWSLIAAAVLLIMTVGIKLLDKESPWTKYLAYSVIGCLCFAAATWFDMGSNWAAFESTGRFIGIITLSLALWGSIVCICVLVMFKPKAVQFADPDTVVKPNRNYRPLIPVGILLLTAVLIFSLTHYHPTSSVPSYPVTVAPDNGFAEAKGKDLLKAIDIPFEDDGIILHSAYSDGVRLYAVVWIDPDKEIELSCRLVTADGKTQNRNEVFGIDDNSNYQELLFIWNDCGKLLEPVSFYIFDGKGYETAVQEVSVAADTPRVFEIETQFDGALICSITAAKTSTIIELELTGGIDLSTIENFQIESDNVVSTSLLARKDGSKYRIIFPSSINMDMEFTIYINDQYGVIDRIEIPVGTLLPSTG